MNAPFRQSERLGRLTTVLGPDILALLRFAGSDYLNDLFEYRVEALATTDDLDFDRLIGTHTTVEIEAHEEMRPFDGIVTSARWAGVGDNGHRYDLTLRPWLWLAGRRRNQRIFHDMTVDQIVRELLVDYAGLGDPALSVKLTRDYPPLEYTVQYRETDLDFLRRQLERHGISFYFAHALGSHSLVLTDDSLSHETLGKRPFKRFDGHHHYDKEHFWDWAPERNLTTGAIRVTDYNFKTPNAAMEADRAGDASHPQGKIESFDYPGDYSALGQGKGVASLRIAQERGGDRRNRAAGDCVSLGSGMRLTLSGDPVPGSGGSYLCLSASHQFVSESYGSGGDAGDGYALTGTYVLMPDDAPMAPPRRTAAALVQGPQTATVVGNGEIDCDEFGRILVRFHWDLAGAHSMRCRVSQNWAGNGWGGMVIPRIGMEVVVEFLEGDPDKPLVTGCVYNGKNDVPYALPAHKTVSTFKSQTHQGSGYNEFRFEDEKDREEVFLHAQKDHNTVIENDESHSIGHDRAKVVGRDQRAMVGRDDSIEIGRDQQEHVYGNKANFVGGEGAGLIGAMAGLIEAGSAFMKKHGGEAGDNVTGLAGEMSKMGGIAAGLAGLMGKLIPGTGTLNTIIAKFRSDTIGIARTEQIGLFKNTVVGHSQSVSVGRKITVVAGEDYDLEAKASLFTRTKLHTAMATEKLVLGGPGGTIIIDASGVTIKASQIWLKSPSIDMASGSPNAAQLKSDKPYAQDCD